MTPRQQRRAQERKARKQSIRSEPAVHKPEPKSDYTDLIAAASLTILLPGEDPAAYRAHLLHFFQHHHPASGVESEIVKRMADLQWRLQRIAGLEAGVFALGRIKYAELFPDADPNLRAALLDAHTLVADGPALKQLQTQENRLRRFYRNDLTELTALQKNRSATAPTTNTTTTEPLPDTVITYTNLDGLESTTTLNFGFSEEEDPVECMNFILGPTESLPNLFPNR